MGKLTVVKVRSLNTPGRFGDGDGLWLQVRSAASKSWLLRYTLAGKAREMGLGDVSLVTLAEAREAALQARRGLREGVDPIDQRKAAKVAAKVQSAPSFREVAALYLKAHSATWKNAKHRAQWPATLELYAYPTIGDQPVSSIDTGAVTRILEPIWHEKPETASRLRGRVETILDFAAVRGWRAGENPARWKGHMDKLLPSRAKVAPIEHHPALPWKEIGAFTAELRAQTGCAALALEFAILTAARTGEVIGATWGEIDLAEAAWTVPGQRMKAGREHRVPLSPAALAVLERVAADHGSQRSTPTAPIFPGRQIARPRSDEALQARPLSDMAMLALLKRMGRGDLTSHGFRSTFRDWASEATAFPGEVAEAALAHTLRDKVEAAYRRGDLFEKRRRLMDDWATRCSQPDAAASGGQVVSIRGVAA